jgi:hypothetical protein
MAFLSAFYPQPVVKGTTAGTYAEGNDARIVGAASKAWPAGVTKTVYLSARTDGVAGSGTLADPYDASNATKFQEILLNRTKVPAGSTVRLLAGNYESFTRVGNKRADGSGNYGVGLPNISIIGDGINSTKITAVAGNDVANMFEIAGDCVRFSDMTIDAGWSVLKTAARTSGAVTIYGGQVSIVERIRVVNFGGDIDTNTEGFPIIIFGSDNMPSVTGDGGTNVTSRNAVIRNCIVEQPYVWSSQNSGKGAYYTALSICGSIFGFLPDYRCDGVAIIENNVIRGAIPDNHVHGGNNLDDANAFRFELGATVGGNLKHIIIRNNTFKNLALGTQADTWHNEHAFIDGNYFDQVGQATLVNMGITLNATIPNSGAGNPVTITTSSEHGYFNGFEAIPSFWEVCKLSTTGELPAPLNEHTIYYVRYVSPTEIRLSETRGGGFIETTTNGSGTHQVRRNSMQNTTISNNVVYAMPSGSSSVFRHDSASQTQRVVIENNWIGTRNPNTTFLNLRRFADLFNINNAVLRNNIIYGNLPLGNFSEVDISVSENNTDENGIERFWGEEYLSYRTVFPKFSDPKKNGLILSRAITNANSAAPNGAARSLTNKATVLVHAGNYELPTFAQIGNNIEIIGQSDARSIRITAPAGSEVFRYQSLGIGSTIKNLTLVAPDGGVAFNSPWAVAEANHANIRYEKIIFTRPSGGTGNMVNVGIIGMGGGTWVDCESEFPMYSVSANQGNFFGKMYNCRFTGGISFQDGGTTTPVEYHDSIISGGINVRLNTNGIMKGCIVDIPTDIIINGGKIINSSLKCRYLDGTGGRIENSTIEASDASYSITGTGSFTLADVGINKPINPTVTVTNYSNSLVSTGTGAPSATAPNGSIYLRTDGDASTTIYVRAGGSWKPMASWEP